MKNLNALLIALLSLAAISQVMAATPFDSKAGVTRVVPFTGGSDMDHNAGASIRSATQTPARDVAKDPHAARFPTVTSKALLRSLVAQDPAAFTAFYRPIGEWTGRLILPRMQEREADGSVLIQVQNTPVSGLAGRVVRLRWDTTDPGNRWFETIRPDVAISAATLAEAKKASSRLPTRLNGWPTVSALESLAGGRSTDDVEVLLENPVYDGNSLTITSDPIQIGGVVKGFVRFVGAEREGYRQMDHFDPAIGDFNPEKREWIHCPTFPSADPKLRPTTRGIETSFMNGLGYYVYGRRTDGMFRLEALEPREMVSLIPSAEYEGKGQVTRYLKGARFEHLRPALSRLVFANPAEGEQGFAGQSLHSVFQPDRVYPVIHLFGWQDEKKTGLMALAPNPGHFSYGTARLVEDEFTGEPRWAITYRQVYAHNREAILAGAQAWHYYMGSLRRGWMYSIPVWDTIIAIPELFPYEIGDWKHDPMVGFCRELDKMNALYRTGAGTGLAAVKPDMSCVQDSNCALYTALRVFEDKVLKDPALKQALAGPAADHPDRKRFEALRSLVNDLEKILTRGGIARWDWKQASTDLLGTRRKILGGNMSGNVARALGSARTIFPRDAQDHLLTLATARGYPFWTLLSAQIGGIIPGIQPAKPTSLRSR